MVLIYHSLYPFQNWDYLEYLRGDSWTLMTAEKKM